MQSKAAEILGMSFRSFRYYAKKYEITLPGRTGELYWQPPASTESYCCRSVGNPVASEEVVADVKSKRIDWSQW